MRRVSIIIPVIRPEKAQRCREAIRENAGVNPDQYEIVMLVDVDGIGCPAMVKQLTAMTLYDTVLFLGDDTIPGKGFLVNALTAMENLPDRWGVVGLNTKGPMFGFEGTDIPDNSNPLAHWMADKRMLEHIPGGDFFPIDYRHCWCDNELRDIAVELGRWTFAEDAKIDHKHPVNKSAEWDAALNKAYSEANQKHDYKTYLKRKRARMAGKYGTRLAVGIPLTSLEVYSHFMFSFLQLEKPEKYDLFMPNFPGQIDAVRNDLVQQALNIGCTHILMMDTDQVYSSPDMIQRMLDHDAPVVGCRVHRRYPPFDPLLLRGETGKLYSVSDEEIKPNGDFAQLIKVDRTGCGCVMFDTSVFIEIDPPWFELKVNLEGKPIGEDFAFCEKLEDAGYPIMVDCSIEIQHLSLLAIDWSTYKLYSKLKMRGEQNG